MNRTEIGPTIVPPRLIPRTFAHFYYINSPMSARGSGEYSVKQRSSTQRNFGPPGTERYVISSGAWLFRCSFLRGMKFIRVNWPASRFSRCFVRLEMFKARKKKREKEITFHIRYWNCDKYYCYILLRIYKYYCYIFLRFVYILFHGCVKIPNIMKIYKL